MQRTNRNISVHSVCLAAAFFFFFTLLITVFLLFLVLFFFFIFFPNSWPEKGVKGTFLRILCSRYPKCLCFFFFGSSENVRDVSARRNTRRVTVAKVCRKVCALWISHCAAFSFFFLRRACFLQALVLRFLSVRERSIAGALTVTSPSFFFLGGGARLLSVAVASFFLSLVSSPLYCHQRPSRLPTYFFFSLSLFLLPFESNNGSFCCAALLEAA